MCVACRRLNLSGSTKTLTGHSDREVAELATLLMEISRVAPGKRSRWLKLAQRHRPLFDRTVAFFGVEFFEDLVAGYGDFESPLWRILEQSRINPAWSARDCDCGSGRPFRDCCLERENDLADQEAGIT